ncbi:MAG TPA: methyltransferase domain-containing protein [Micropruina sp.]|nr:methyltransferase domain-containing protein [Micropruina sp.]
MTDQTRPNPTDTAEAVEAVIAQLMGELGGSLGVLLTDLGLRAGIWPALRGTGPVTVADLAARTGVAAPLLREWLRSQAAAGYLSHHPGTTGPDQDRFALPEPVAIALLDAPGGAIVGACTEMLISMAEHHDALGDAIAGDGGLGWDERDFRHWHGADRLTRATLPAELIAAAVDAMEGIAPALDAGGTVLDVGCGFGFPTLTIAGHHPGARAIGIDYHARSVAEASSRAERAGLADRVSFQVAAATDPPGSGYALITYFDSLHDFGDPVAALRAARSVLAPGGAVLVCENAAADTVAENLNPAGRMFYAVSALVCTPNALSQRGPGADDPLGTFAGAARLTEIAREAGFGRMRRIETPGAMSLFLDLRV